MNAETIAEYEECLIGAILVDAAAGGNAIESVRDQITRRDFTLMQAQHVFAAIEDTHDAGATPDVIPVLRKAKSAGITAGYMHGLCGKGLVHNIPHYVASIAENRRREQIRQLSRDIGKAIDSGDSVSSVLDRIECDLVKLSGGIEQSAVRDAYAVGNEIIDRLQESKLTGTESGLRTGIIPLDQHTNGLQPSTLTTIAARTSAGKSALGLQIADNACHAGASVFYVSLEMSAAELMGRNIANDTGIDSALIAGCRLDGAMATDHEIVDIRRTVERYRDKHLRFFDPPALSASVADIRRRAKAMHADHPLHLLVVDYVALVKPKDRRASRPDQLGDIAKGLKSLASELRIPVVTLAQVNRDGVNRDGSKRETKPDLQHLADSDQVARDSDNVWILHRPNLSEPATSLLIRKQRGAPVGEISLVMELPRTRFAEPPITSHPNYNSEFIDYDNTYPERN